MSNMTEESYDLFLHDLKNLVIDLNIVKQKVEVMSNDQRMKIIEDRMNVLLLDNAKLKLVLEDLCQEVEDIYQKVDQESYHKPKTRKKS